MANPRGSAVNRSIELFAYVAVLAYYGCFAAWNSATNVDVQVWFDGTRSDGPVFFPVLASFVVGILVAGAMGALGSLRRGAEGRQSRRRIEALEAELARLRNLPLDEDLSSARDADGADSSIP